MGLTKQKAKIICHWCKHEFTKYIYSTDGERGQTKCPKCLRLIPSSIKERIEGKSIGRQHIHKDYPTK